MIRGNTINLEDILICRSQKDFIMITYTPDQLNRMIINIMTVLAKTKGDKKRQHLLKIIEDLRLIRLLETYS